MISGWFDMHIHALPGVDDGARDIEMTEQMLRLAFSDGTHHMIFTPHYCAGKFEADTTMIQSRFDQVCHMAKQIVPDMTLYLGHELFYNNDLINLLQKRKVRTLADSSYILVEFAYKRDYIFIRWALEQLQSAGYRVILAHFERYACLKDRIDRLRELATDGIHLQITANYANEMSKRFFSNYVKKAFQEHLIHFIGTDAHNTSSRKPLMGKYISNLCKKYGEKYIREIALVNPERVVQNKYI